jgi:hypothetical protein
MASLSFASAMPMLRRFIEHANEADSVGKRGLVETATVRLRAVVSTFAQIAFEELPSIS